MSSDAMSSPRELRAYNASTTQARHEWGWVASAKDHVRYALPAPDKRRKCYCGCNGRATHVGMANGLAMCGGCELWITRWVRDGYPPPKPRPVTTLVRNKTRAGTVVHTQGCTTNPAWPEPWEWADEASPQQVQQVVEASGLRLCSRCSPLLALGGPHVE
jgi:hypothetical protein